MTRTAVALAVLACVLLAGCASAPSANDGSVAVFVSDQQNAIGDFEHVNVTITRVSLKRAGGWGGGHEGHQHRHRGRWVSYEVPNQTVDLTRLQGENATLLETVDVANGTYRVVALHVSRVDGRLANASANGSADLVLPNDRLMVHKRFSVADGEDLQFVFDVTVVERDGRYVLQPMASESAVGHDVCDCDGRHGGMHDGDGMHDGGMNGSGMNGGGMDDGGISG